jgi:hypothetical protein
MSEATDKTMHVSWASARGRVEQRTIIAAYHQQVEGLITFKRAGGEVVLTVKSALIEAIEPLEDAKVSA